MHQVSGRWRLGLVLALSTAAFWATLPIALKVALEQIDPYTLTWARFAFAAAVMLLWLAARRQLGQFRDLGGRRWLMLALAGLMLIGNYVGYLLGLKYTTPANAQLLIQAAPLLMGLGGLMVFGERYSIGQWIGLVAIVAGLGLFFSDQSGRALPAGGDYLLGAALIGVAALVWAVYALLQKQLLMNLSSPAILGFIYVVATLVLWPLAHPEALLALDRRHVLALVYCALNTLGAYGAFAEALAHWEASRVSVVLALTPLLCVGAVASAHALNPDLIAPEHIGLLGWLGALAVVAGSAVSSLLRPSPRGVAGAAE
jgi:drug/metabolite transporter (DMT)-like permease